MSTQSSDPRERAQEYKQSESGDTVTPSSAPKRPVRLLQQWETAAGEAIEEAMRQGSFDNLRGKGKPLNLGREAYTPSDSALAFDILKNNDLTPTWLQQRNDLLRDIEKWRSNLRQIVAQANAASTAAKSPADREAFAARWQVQRRSLQAQVEEFNRRIGTVNLQLPAVSMEVFKLRLGEELQRAGIAF